MAMSAPQATPWGARGFARRAPAAMPATAVPWEKSSTPVSSTASGVNSSVTVIPAAIFSANAGWSRSIPVSMKPMVTPAPGSASSPLSRLRLA